jgi:hypothetical protein
LLKNNSATPTATPTHAPRVSVRLNATSKAGMMNAAHKRPEDPYSSRAVAAQITSINVPEYVIQCDSVPTGRRPSPSKFNTAYWTMPMKALSAPMVRMTLKTDLARAPRARS